MASKPEREGPPTRWRDVVDEILRFLITDDLLPQRERDLGRGLAEVSFAGRTVTTPEANIASTVEHLRRMAADDGLSVDGEPLIRRRRFNLKQLGSATVNIDSGLRSALATYFDLILEADDADYANKRFAACRDALESLCSAPLTDDAIATCRRALRRALGRKAGRESQLSRSDRIQRACGLAVETPNLSTKEIAQRVGVDRGTLSRSPIFRRAREASMGTLRSTVGGSGGAVSAAGEMPHGSRNARLRKLKRD